MKILILSKPDPYRSAGIVAKDLLEGFNSTGNISAKLLVGSWGKYKDTDIISLQSKPTYYVKWYLNKMNAVINKFRKYVYAGKPKTLPEYYIKDYDQTVSYYDTAKILRQTGFNPDVIVVLFMYNFLSFKNLYELNDITKAPIFLYMMDMAPMTGGCHYAWDCNGYINECGSCPALYSHDKNDQTHSNYTFKKIYIQKTNIFPIAASEWQYLQLKKSGLFKDKRKFKTLLSINDAHYFPTDKLKVRKELSLPANKKIIFCGSVLLSEKRKGFKELIESFNILSGIIEDPSLIHIVIAGSKSDIFENIMPFSYTLLGYLGHNELPKAFQAADIFVSPSIEDSGPMMINQSVMCGTPVVAFDIGVALDLVINRETGYRAKLKDSHDFAYGIKYILELEDLQYKEMSLNCRETALRLCHPRTVINNFIEILSGQLSTYEN